MNEQEQRRLQMQQNISQIEQQQAGPQFNLDSYQQIAQQKRLLEGSRDETIVKDVKLGIEEYSVGKEVLRRENVIAPPQEDSKAGMMKSSRKKVETTRKEALVSASQQHVVNYSADTILFKNELAKYQKNNPNGIDPNKVNWQKELTQLGVTKDAARTAQPGSDAYKKLHMFSESYTFFRRCSINIEEIKDKIGRWEVVLQKKAAGAIAPTPEQEKKLLRLENVCAAAKQALKAELRLNGIDPETGALITEGSPAQQVLKPLEELKAERDMAVAKYQDALVYNPEKEVFAQSVEKLRQLEQKPDFAARIAQERAQLIENDHRMHPEQANLNFSISNGDMAKDFKKLKETMDANPQNYERYRNIIDAEYTELLSFLQQSQESMLRLRVLDDLVNGAPDGEDYDTLMSTISNMSLEANLKTLAARSIGMMNHLLHGGEVDVTGFFAKEVEQKYGLETPFRAAYKQRRETFTEQTAALEQESFRTHAAGKNLLRGITRIKGLEGETEAALVYHDIGSIADFVFGNLPSNKDDYIHSIQLLQQTYEQLEAHCEAVSRVETDFPEMLAVKAQTETIRQMAKQERTVISSRAVDLMGRALQGVVPATELLKAMRTAEVDVTGVNLHKLGGDFSEVYHIESENSYFKTEDKPKNAEEFIEELKTKHPELAGECDVLSPVLEKCLTDNNFLADLEMLFSFVMEGKQALLEDLLSGMPSLAIAADLLRDSGSILHRLKNDLFHYISSETVRQKRTMIDTGRDMVMRNVATSRVAKLLSAGNLVTDAKMANLTRDGQVFRRGVIMETAPGVELPSLQKKMVNGQEVPQTVVLSPEMKLQLCDLAVLDNLCGQVDRHGLNYKVLYQQEEDHVKITSMKAIDNDLAFGKRSGENIDSTDPQVRHCNTINIDELNIISRSMYENIMGLEEDTLKYTLSDLLNNEEMDALFSRLHKIKDVLTQKLDRRELKVIASPQNWDNAADDVLRKMSTAFKDTIDTSILKHL